MKADHRHELKTNELAEWIANLPQWAKENRTMIIGVTAVIALAAGIYFWQSYRKNVAGRNQLRLTGLTNQLALAKIQILQAQSEGRDLSFILLQPAENLKVFAQDTSNEQMAALALIERAEALRSELHYRPGQVSEQDLQTAINQAKASYAEALERASANLSLTATAKFGLGLCEEELGNFEQARQIYQDVAADPNFEGTTAQAAAKHRLDTMADYKTKVVFKPAPKPPAPASPEASRGGGQATTIGQPPLELKPKDSNRPTETNLPIGIQAVPEGPNIVPLVPDVPAVKP